MNHTAPAFYLACLILLLPVNANSQQQEDPGRVVSETVNAVLGVLGEAGLSEPDKREKVYALVQPRIDFEGMSRRVLALNWKNATDEQLARFVALFRHILLDSYWTRIRNFRNEKVEYVTTLVEPNGSATVDTVIVRDRLEIPISYRMELVNGRWMAYDFLVESLSLVTNFRVEYRNLIKLGGIDGLLAQMQAEVDRINAS